MQALLRLQEHADEEEKDGSHKASTTRTLSYCPKHVAHVFARVDATPIASASIAQVSGTVFLHVCHCGFAGWIWLARVDAMPIASASIAQVCGTGDMQ